MLYIILLTLVLCDFEKNVIISEIFQSLTDVGQSITVSPVPAIYFHGRLSKPKELLRAVLLCHKKL